MRIAVFGGSFDPVHTEHIRVAAAAIESLRLDKLIVMPAHTPPHKPDKTLSSDEDRLAMCRLAFANVDKAEVSDYEIAKGGTSYTYLTCRHFRKTYKDAEIFWLVGTDMLRDFPTWKEPRSILNDVTLAVCARAEKAGWLERERAQFQQKFDCDFAVVDYNGANVSSTEIRVLAGAGMCLTPLVSEEIQAYIRERGLYNNGFAEKALALQSEKRRAHSVRVALTAATKALTLKIPEDKAIEAALFHDCAKNLPENSPLLEGFEPPKTWGEVPGSVVHQFAGAYVVERTFGVTDEEVLNAIRYHTSARPAMSGLEKLIFLADMVEEGRAYEGVDTLRRLFWKNDRSIPPENRLDECLEEALFQTLVFLKEKGAETYPLTEEAYAFYAKTDKENKDGGIL